MDVQIKTPSAIGRTLSKALRSDIRKDIVSRYINACLRESCELIVKEARHNHRYKDYTGRLTRSIAFMVNKREPLNSRTADIFINTDGRQNDNHADVAEYGRYQLEGTGIYGKEHRWITPYNARLLHWYSRNRYARGTREWFASKVRGVKPDNFISKAYKSKWRYIIKSVWEAKLKEWRSLNGII